jgi:hypothetical protein
LSLECENPLTLADRLRDPGLSEGAWAEALASFVVSKPPSRWASGDEARFCEEIAALAELFHKVEATAFNSGSDRPAPAAIRLNLTRGDGAELLRVIEPRANEDGDIRNSIDRFQKMLPTDRHARLDVLARLLWNELSSADEDHTNDKDTAVELAPQRT